MAQHQGWIRLNWWNVPGTVETFLVERCDKSTCEDADFVIVAEVATAGADHSSMDYHDVGLQEWIIYTYRLRARNQAGESGPSNQMQGRVCIEEHDWIAPCFAPLPESVPPAFAVIATALRR